MLCSMAVNDESNQMNAENKEPIVAVKTPNRGWFALLLLPYLGLLFPGLYSRATPALWGFPFFYWYQFMWVILASGLIFIVYRKIKY
jgi:hypothetical protein